MWDFLNMSPEQLRSLREARGLTREQLAAQLGDCTASTINKWERGMHEIPGWVAEKMLTNVKLDFPLTDLHALLDFARESGESFETFLSSAVREYLARHRSKQPAPSPVKTGAVYPFPQDEPALQVAEPAHTIRHSA